MSGNIVDNVKKGVNGVKSFGMKMVKTVKFLLTPIGHVVGIIALVAMLVVIVGVISKVIEHSIGIFFHDDYAGISSADDYEVIVGELGYTGYSSFISEKLWQEYSAFEYAVLMDVAEHIYENQDYVTTKKYENRDGEEVEYRTSAVFPEGIARTQYDAESGDNIDKKWWVDAVAKGQAGDAPTDVGNNDEVELPGGNRDVVRPRLVYEEAIHEYEDELTSLMPYIVIVRESLELNYFFNGLDEETLLKYKNLQEIDSSDLESAGENLNPVTFSAELNRFNYNMPSSGYKKDLEEKVNHKLVLRS